MNIKQIWEKWEKKGLIREKASPSYVDFEYIVDMQSICNKIMTDGITIKLTPYQIAEMANNYQDFDNEYEMSDEMTFEIKPDNIEPEVKE